MINSSNPNTPYSQLNPDLILNAIESVGYRCSGSLLALNSYENRVYQIGLEDAAPLIAKFYRPARWSDAAILEEHQFALELAEREIPVVTPIIDNNHKTLHEYAGFRFAIFPRKGGRALELDKLDQLEWMGRFIGRLHAVGACRSFQHRLRLDEQSYGYTSYQFLLQHNFIPTELKQAYCTIVETILERITLNFQQLGTLNYLRLHGDCHAGNILWNDTGPHIVDLDDCLMGPAIQDLWMLISGNTPDDIDLQVQSLLRGYQEFYDFNYSELRLIETLRTLRMLHYSAWLAKRWEDPTFPQHFPWFNTLSYWREQLHHLAEQQRLLEQASSDVEWQE